MGYTITFVDRAERKYRLLIDGGETALDGGAVTFETQEDNDADMFMPVRCQTGAFRYIGKNDHATWLGLIPTDALSKTVILQRQQGNTWNTRWQGYIQPQVFENEYPGNGTVEHDFSVQCPLSVLDTLDIDPSPTTTINSNPTITFGALLQTYVFNRLTGTTISAYVMQGTTAVTSSRLGLKVMWANFLDTDSNNNVVCKYTCKQVLEEFCKFFGYTCRIHGTVVYFTQPTGNNVGFSSYTTLAGTPTAVQRGSFSITGSMLCDTDNHEEVHPGIGKATVRSDINALDNLVEIPYDELFDKYNMGNLTQQSIVRPVDYYERGVYNLIRQPDSNGGTLTYENDTVSLSCLMTTKPGTNNNAGDQKRYCRFFVYDDGDVGEIGGAVPESKTNFSWRKCIELFHSYVSGTPAGNIEMFKITSKQVFVVSDGILYINFKCDEVSAWITTNQNPYATCRLKIGNKYWTGSWSVNNRRWENSGWSDNSNSTFTLLFSSEGARSTRGSVTDPQYNGCGIPIDNTMRGAIEFTILDVPAWKFPMIGTNIDINGFLPLLDFEIGFVRGTIEDTKHRGNEYTTNGGKFRDEVNVDLIWASDVAYGEGSYIRHMPAGMGYILNGTTEKPTQYVKSMTGGDVIPEQYLSQLIANYGQSTHRLVQMNLRSSSLGDVVPTAVSSGLESGMFPLSISHNWRNDTTTLTLIQI